MRNLEAKFRTPSYDSSRSAIRRVAGLPIEYLQQIDRYYQPLPERAILRTVRIIEPVPDFYYEQICYRRNSLGNGLQISDYYKIKGDSCHHVMAGHSAKQSRIFLNSPEPKIRVAKYRRTFTFNQFRIHLDFVNHLGCFVEVIRPLQDKENEEAAQADFWSIIEKLNLSPNSIIDESYIDLLK